MPEARYSIVITCYNQQDYIRQAVDSALIQGPNVREVIVVDDASTDGSVAILESYGEAIRLLCFSKNQGCIAARNEGAARAQGEYIMFLDGDDILAPWTVRVYERVMAEKQPKIIIANPYYFRGVAPIPGDDPVDIRFVTYRRLIDKDRPRPIYPSFALERKMFEQMGRWTPGIFHLDLDDICMKLAGEGPTIMICAPCTFYYRYHDANSINKVAPFIAMLRLIIRKTKTGQYPDDAALRFRRNAWLGSVVRYWAKRARQEKLYKEYAHLAIVGWIPVVSSLWDRAFGQRRKRLPMERIAFEERTRLSRKGPAARMTAKEATVTLLGK